MTYDMWMHGGWANQRDPGFREMVPRFVLAIILAALSLWLCRLALVLLSNMSCYIASSLEVGVWGIIMAIIDLVVGVLLLAYMPVGKIPVLGIYMLLVLFIIMLVCTWFFLMYFFKVLLQMLLRLCLLAVLIVLSPLAFMLMATPDTESWTRRWLSTFVPTCVSQAVQLVVLFVGFSMLKWWNLDVTIMLNVVVGYIAGTAIVYLASQVPALLDRWLGAAYTGGGSAVEKGFGLLSGIAKQLAGIR